MRQIPPGTTGTATLRVQSEHLANRFKDSILPLSSTPLCLPPFRLAAGRLLVRT